MRPTDRLRHVCPAAGCRRMVRYDYLMCGEHWRLVPSALQQAVWRTYRTGPLSRPHVAACDAAIEAVNRRLEQDLVETQELPALRLQNGEARS